MKSGKESKASDTMGTKHGVGFAVYKVMGSVNVQLAEKTGFSQEDAEVLKEALKTLFENDASSARPEGSMEVLSECTGGSMMKKHRQFPVERFREDLQIKAEERVIQKNLRIMTFLGT